MIKVGLTGGIGSGKSTVAAIFEILGVPVYYADAAAKNLMITLPALVESVTSVFGENAYLNGCLNRNFIAKSIFSDPSKRELLNAAVHPYTIEDANNWFNRQNHPYAIKEAALIFESHAHQELNIIIGVYTPVELRIARIMQRDNLTKEEVTARVNAQLNEEEKMRRCDYVIVNDEQSSLISQVTEIHHKIMSRAL